MSGDLKFKYTFISILFGIAFIFSSFVFDFDLFENLLTTLKSFETFELEELIIVCLIVGAGIGADGIAMVKALKQNEKNYKDTVERVIELKLICNDLSQPLMGLMGQCELAKIANENETRVEFLDKDKVNIRLSKIQDLITRLDDIVSDVRQRAGSITDEKISPS